MGLLHFKMWSNVNLILCSKMFGTRDIFNYKAGFHIYFKVSEDS